MPKSKLCLFIFAMILANSSHIETKIVSQDPTIFTKKPSTKVNNSASFIRGINQPVVDPLKCLYECIKDFSCRVVEVERTSGICRLFGNVRQLVDMMPSTNHDLLQKNMIIPPFEGLTNYWPIQYASTHDAITGLSLNSSGQNAYLGPDRFYDSTGALEVTEGFFTAPAGVYFSGDFTITGWVYVKEYRYYSRFLDFSNGEKMDNIIFSISDAFSGKPFIQIYQYLSVAPAFIVSNTAVPLNVWTHLGLVLNGTNLKLYLNSAVVASGTVLVPRNVTRSQCYFGKSAFPLDALASARYDEIKIFNRSLNAIEIWNEYTNFD